jgi:mRNA-degrading endonuclease RelE of RelBE toxin-antitoxin system
MSNRTVIWSPKARADLRAIDRTQAMQILETINRYVSTGAGDVIQLQPPRSEFRLRVGDYRVVFVPKGEAAIEVMRVRHRREAYR